MTTVNLKVAHSIVKQIDRAIGDVPTPSHYKEIILSDVDTVVKELDVEDSLLANSLKQIEVLLDVKCEVRKAIAKANLDCGLSDRLSERAILQEFQKKIYPTVNADVRHNTATIESLVERINNSSNVSMYDISTRMATLTQESKKLVHKEYEDTRKQIAKLEHEIETLNYTTSVSIPDEVFSLLDELGIELFTS